MPNDRITGFRQKNVRAEISFMSIMQCKYIPK